MSVSLQRCCHISNGVLLSCDILTCSWLINRRPDTGWHLNYTDRWAAADKWPCLSPTEAPAQTKHMYSTSIPHAAYVSLLLTRWHPGVFTKRLKLLTCQHYKPENQLGLFGSLRFLKTNRLKPIYSNKDASALDEAGETLWTSVIRFSSEGERGSADRAKACVFIEWLLCEVHPCLVTPSSLPAGCSAPACKEL